MTLPFKIASGKPQPKGRTRVDPLPWAFGICLVGGGVCSFGTVYGFANSAVTVGVPIAVTVVYCVIAFLQARRRDNQDFESAGDSCYYLGFLLTLISLIGSLIGLSQIDSSREIVLERFGVALVTTVIGMLVRIIMVQFRKTPVERRDLAGEQLSKAMADLSTMVGQGLDQFEQSLQTASTRMSKAGDEVFEQLRRSAQAHDAAIKTMLKQAQGGYDETVDTLREKLEEVDFAPEQVRDSLHGLHDALQEEIDGFREQVAGLKQATNQNKTAWGKLTGSVDGASQKLEAFSDRMAALESVNDALMDGAAATEKFAQKTEELAWKVEAAGQRLDDEARDTEAYRGQLAEELSAIKQLREEIAAERKEAASAVSALYREMTGMAEHMVAELGGSDGGASTH